MAPKSYHIYHDLFINATSEKLFNAVSKPAELINWWPLTCAGEEKTVIFHVHFWHKNCKYCNATNKQSSNYGAYY